MGLSMRKLAALLLVALLAVFFCSPASAAALEAGKKKKAKAAAATKPSHARAHAHRAHTRALQPHRVHHKARLSNASNDAMLEEEHDCLIAYSDFEGFPDRATLFEEDKNCKKWFLGDAWDLKEATGKAGMDEILSTLKKADGIVHGNREMTKLRIVDELDIEVIEKVFTEVTECKVMAYAYGSVWAAGAKRVKQQNGGVTYLNTLFEIARHCKDQQANSQFSCVDYFIDQVVSTKDKEGACTGGIDIAGFYGGTYGIRDSSLKDFLPESPTKEDGCYDVRTKKATLLAFQAYVKDAFTSDDSIYKTPTPIFADDTMGQTHIAMAHSDLFEYKEGESVPTTSYKSFAGDVRASTVRQKVNEEVKKDLKLFIDILKKEKTPLGKFLETETLDCPTIEGRTEFANVGNFKAYQSLVTTTYAELIGKMSSDLKGSKAKAASVAMGYQTGLTVKFEYDDTAGSIRRGLQTQAYPDYFRKYFGEMDNKEKGKVQDTIKTMMSEQVTNTLVMGHIAAPVPFIYSLGKLPSTSTNTFVVGIDPSNLDHPASQHTYFYRCDQNHNVRRHKFHLDRQYFKASQAERQVKIHGKALDDDHQEVVIKVNLPFDGDVSKFKVVEASEENKNDPLEVLQGNIPQETALGARFKNKKKEGETWTWTEHQRTMRQDLYNEVVEGENKQVKKGKLLAKGNGGDFYLVYPVTIQLKFTNEEGKGKQNTKKDTKEIAARLIVTCANGLCPIFDGSRAIVIGETCYQEKPKKPEQKQTPWKP